MRRGWWVLLPGLLLTASACGGGARPTPTGDPVRVEVTNNYALPMEVFVVGSGINHRLGLVHPGMVSHFVIPPSLLGNGAVEFQAQPSATASAQRVRTGQLLLDPGVVVDFVITAQLFNSTATVRP